MKKLYFITSFLLISSFGFAQETYYNDINTELTTLTGIPLKDALATKIINTHVNTLSYSDARECLKIIDLETGQTDNVLLIYGFSNNTCPTSTSDDNDHRLRNKNSFGGGATCEWNREHVYAQSQGTPPLGQSGPGADAHHLRASDVQRNGQRSNLHFITGSGNSGGTNGGWYPGNEWKGDVARIIMYMYVRYGNQCLPSGITIGNSNSVDSNMIDLLLDWNAADPVSDYEDVRNAYHDNNATYSQGNRNPFIDNPHLATRIWGGTSAEDRWGIYATDAEAPTIPTNLSISNETSSSVDLDWTASTDNVGVSEYDIYVDNVFNSSSNTNSHTVTGLSASTTYSFTVLAKDIANNESGRSVASNGTTLAGGGSGSNCVSETFENIPASSSSYSTHQWNGDDNFEWIATDARTDQTITTRTITIRNGSLTTTQSVSGGIGDLTVTTQLVFTGSSGTFDLKVNGVSKGNIPYDSTVQTTTIPNINVEGNVTILIDSNSSGSNRVRFDDLTWTCNSTLDLDSFKLSDAKLFPNPSDGNTITVSSRENIRLTFFDILGKKVLESTSTSTNKTVDVSKLRAGIYFVKLENETGSTTKKFIMK